MFSHELFDFVSMGHPSDVHVDPSDQHHDSLFDSYIDSSYVDQSFCSDFACCGQNLPDLHCLLEHFEEEHVLPLSPDARPLCSSPVYAQPRSTASAPYTSYILSYPQPDPPLQAVTHSISASGPDSRTLPSLQFSTIPPVPDLTHTPLSPSPTASSATSAHSSPDPGEPLCLPPSLFSVQHTPPPRSRRDRPRVRDASDTDADVDDTDEEAEPDAEFADAPPTRPAPKPKLPLSSSGNSAGPHRRARHCSAARMDPVSARSRPVDRERGRVPLSPATPKRRDERKKSHKCPHSGCTKSYLNPNGLKYHLEKGTCTNAGVRGREPLPPAPASASVSLPCHVPTTPAAIATAVGSASVPSTVVAEDGDSA